MVGAIGFEPTTPCAQGRCATRLRYAPTNFQQITHCTGLRVISNRQRQCHSWTGETLLTVKDISISRIILCRQTEFAPAQHPAQTLRKPDNSGKNHSPSWPE